MNDQEKLKLCIETLEAAKRALNRTIIHSTTDGVWINSRVKGSAMWGLQDAEPEIIESFQLSAELNREAEEAIDKTLSILAGPPE